MQAKFITLKSESIQATVTNYGARLVGLITNDKNGKPVDVVAGFNTVDEYRAATSPYYGATIGRYANRIARGQFSLNGQSYQAPVNNGENCLHGGGGFHDKVWMITAESDSHTVMQYTSADMEDGFPGELQVTVTFTLDNDTFKIDYRAITNADTVLNLTNHAYFNLNGEDSGSIEQHQLSINAAAYTPINHNLIPTGQLASVANTPFDFRAEQVIGARINDDFEQLTIARGYDHNYVLNKNDGDKPEFAAKATGDKTGITLAAFTTEPGMQFYTGNFMDGTNIFKSGLKDEFRTCFCLETQHFPDSPNQAAFPSTVLKPGEVFTSATHYQFGVAD